MAEAQLKEPPTGLAKISLSKAQKAALIFLFLEEKGAASLFQQMSDDEIKTIGSTLLQMDEIPIEEMSMVIGEFYESLGSPVPNQFSGKRIFEKLVEKTLPVERRGRIHSVDDIKGGKGSKHNPLEGLFAPLEATQIHDLIKTESAQTMAVILTLIRPASSKEVLNLFGATEQIDVLYRMSLLSNVSEDVLKILSQHYKAKIQVPEGGVLEKKVEKKSMDVPGSDLVLKYLRTQDSAKAEEILSNIEKSNPEVANAIRKKMFTLEDLLRTDNNGIRALLKGVETSNLSLALKNAPPSVQNLIFQNMSTRAASMLKEDMEVITPKPEDMEAAIEKILTEAKRLVKDGEMVLQSVKE